MARWWASGFNWFEAALYVAQGYAEYGVAPYGAQLGVRYALFGLGGHAMFTGMFGAVPWARAPDAAHLAAHPRAALRAVLAIAAHMLNNALPLFAALAAAAEGQPPDQEIERVPEYRISRAFVSGTLLQLTIFLPFSADHRRLRCGAAACGSGG